MGGWWGQSRRGFSFHCCKIRARSADSPAWITSSVSEQMVSVSQTPHHPIEMLCSRPALLKPALVVWLFKYWAVHPRRWPLCAGLQAPARFQRSYYRGVDSSLQNCGLISSFYWEHSSLGQERNLSPGWVILVEVVTNSLEFWHLKGPEASLRLGWVGKLIHSPESWKV